MNLLFSASENIESVFDEITKNISTSIRIRYIDKKKPWGGYFVIEEDDIEVFIYQFFPQFKKEDLGPGKLSPKILVVAPGKRLSWQYHHRRAEIWKVIGGQVGVITSHTDIEGDKKVLQTGEIIELKKEERHRLVGLDAWGVIAEVWRHTEEGNPSNEDDIIRVRDDFGR